MTGRRRSCGNGVGEQDLVRSVIGVIGSIDTYRLPDAKGFTSLMWELTGDTDEAPPARGARRSSAPRDADFAALADALEQVAAARPGRGAGLGDRHQGGQRRARQLPRGDQGAVTVDGVKAADRGGRVKHERGRRAYRLPDCGGTNRVAAGKDAREAKCGKCGEALFHGAPVAADAAAFDKQITEVRRAGGGRFLGRLVRAVPHHGADLRAACADELEPKFRFLKLDTEAEPAGRRRATTSAASPR